MGKLHSNFSRTNELLEGNISIYLDFIRGVSAILVVMEHLSSRLFVGYGNVEHPNVLVQLLYLLNILGGPSVIIFFVLSGLFISRSVLKAVFENKWSWQEYLINRLSRLYVVLIPALILTFILDMIAASFFEYGWYNNAYDNLKEFIGNLFFLQNIFVEVYGSNAPLWSLNHEFWYYMLFPILFLLFSYKQSKLAKLFYLLTAALIISTIGIRMNIYFIVWLFGTLVLLLPRVNFLSKHFVPILALLLLFAAMIVRPLVMTGRLFTESWTENLFVVDLFLAFAFGFFVYSLLHFVSDKIRGIELKRLGNISKLIAGFSFSLYLLHYPIINTFYYWAASNGFTGFQPGIASVLLEVLFVALICMIAFLFSRITEARTPLVRKFMKTTITVITFSSRDKSLKKQNVTG